MSAWKGGLWASQRYPNGGGPWKGGLWRSQQRAAIWTPAALFANGEQGVFYVPQPVVDGQQVLFTDASGTTPVTADGDPVGLMLDRHAGLVLGPELVTNGDFDTDLSGWSSGSSAAAEHWQWESGRAYHPFTEIYKDIKQSVSGEGVYTEIRFDIERVSGYPNFIVDRLDGTILQFSQPEVSGVVSQSYILEDVVQIRFARRSTGSEFYIDNISVRELPGNHATSATSIERPLYSDNPPLQVYDGLEDAMAVTLPPIAAATVAIATPTGANIQYPVDLSSGSYTITESHSGIIIREGELTPDEQQQVTAYLNNLKGV